MRIECFISYSREDYKIVLQIVSLLQKESIEPWWDEKISPTTNNFTQEIKDAITNCQCFLVIWTGNSVKSEWVLAETMFIQTMENCSDKVISIAINNPSVPPPFNIKQHLNISLPSEADISQEDKVKILSAVKSKIGIIGSNERVIKPRTPGEIWGLYDLAIEGPVPGTNLLLSFRPFGQSGTFLIMHFNTTDGWVCDNIPNASQRHMGFDGNPEYEYFDGNRNKYIKIRNDVYFIKDPIRPYSIQIGGIRSTRPYATPGIIEGTMNPGELQHLPIHLYWLSLTLAEILTNTDTLNKLSELIERYRGDWGQDNLHHVKEAIARNPFSPLEIQKASCKFCDSLFKEKRQLCKKYGATLIANDFPFGPSFHYIAILDDSVHSWEDVQYNHLLGINKITHEYLSQKENIFNAAGIEYGFNSTVRHLVLGSKTQSSAGASIPHIHKHIWGMAPKATNLADQLITVSEAYSDIRIDYQECYIEALRNAGYVVWEDESSVLYVPYGQCSLHELQLMIKRPFGTYLEFTEEEVISLSKAEFLVFRIYKKLGITSFNSIFITKPFHETRAPTFRVVQAFVTREVDLAVSELSTLYVVDQHPNESKNKIKKTFNEIQKEVARIIS